MVQVLYAKELLANCLQTWLQKLVAYKFRLLEGSRQSNQIPAMLKRQIRYMPRKHHTFNTFWSCPLTQVCTLNIGIPLPSVKNKQVAIQVKIVLEGIEICNLPIMEALTKCTV